MAKKIEQGTPAWERSVADLAYDYLNIVQCRKCGHARVQDNICIRCGHDSSYPIEEN